MKELTTAEIVTLLTQAMNEQNQEKINKYAYQLTLRIYVPGTDYAFEDILEGFGYKKIEEPDRQISIEEYMRERKEGR